MDDTPQEKKSDTSSSAFPQNEPRQPVPNKEEQERRARLRGIALPPRNNSVESTIPNTQKTPEDVAHNIATTLQEKGIPFTKKEGSQIAPSVAVEKKSALSQIRTFRGDVETTVEQKKTSVIDIVAKEQERHAGEPPQMLTRTVPVVPILLVLGVLIFFVGGIGLATYTYFITRPEEIVIAKTDAPLVFAELDADKIVGTTDKKTIMGILEQEKRDAKIPLGSIEWIRLLKAKNAGEGFEPLTAEAFLTSIEAKVSSSFVRSLKPEMMVGLYTFDYTFPFLIFKTTSYEQAFAGMLEWEKTMPRALDPFVPNSFGDDLATFSDTVIQNKDVRILTNASSTPILMYSFIDKDTVIITNSENTLLEILKRRGSTRSVGG